MGSSEELQKNISLSLATLLEESRNIRVQSEQIREFSRKLRLSCEQCRKESEALQEQMKHDGLERLPKFGISLT